MTKQIFITGADGFIGSHLTEMLVKEGYKVKALSLYNSFNSWGWLEDIDVLNEIEVISGDIRDQDFCNGAMKNIDIVFHLAALIGIPYSYQAPSSYLDTNIKGTLNICQSSLNNDVERVIHTSTSEVYGTAKYVPIDEEHPLQPQSPYSASKIAADSIAMSYFNSFNLPLIIARPFNTYGPRQSARAIIPTIITQIASGKETINLGDLTPTRDLTYVEDTCKAFYLLSSSDQVFGNTINIGTNSEISIGDLCRKIQEIMGKEVKIVEDNERIRPKNSEVFRLLCDNNKIKNLTGFSPEISIDDGLNRTISWLVKPENLARYKSEIFNV